MLDIGLVECRATVFSLKPVQNMRSHTYKHDSTIYEDINRSSSYDATCILDIPKCMTSYVHGELNSI
jgi:hypothetical protein